LRAAVHQRGHPRFRLSEGVRSSATSCLLRHDSAGVDHLRPSSQLDQPLDAALKSRLRAVLAGRSVTEAELRKLFEEGRACSLILSGELEHTEQRLADLSLDAASSMADLAAAVRRANELRPDLDELQPSSRSSKDERASFERRGCHAKTQSSHG
jgi:hypothetical protein